MLEANSVKGKERKQERLKLGWTERDRKMVGFA
jgi:hypothetical protein